MLKISPQFLIRSKVFWSGIIIILLITSITSYILKEKEKLLRIYMEKELSKTVETKKIVENNLIEAKKEITARKEAEVWLASVVEEKNVLEAKLEEPTVNPKNIELEKIVIKTTPDLTGKVLVFDKEHVFVVINLGSKNNLKLGNILSVYRDDKFIGRVQVEKIEEKTSAAVILTPWKNVEFKESDVVKEI
ncbi:MAG: hypothetical protein HY776_00670 [Actinobacteria bacterium]|nr:hypothetical protein [Actinomycetota bacterium]